MLFNDPGKNVFAHLCHPEPDMDERTVTEKPTRHCAADSEIRPLTSRETEVLVLLHKGLTISEIAVALSISQSTVRNHTQHIFPKLHVHSRYEAVALGRKLGFV